MYFNTAFYKWSWHVAVNVWHSRNYPFPIQEPLVKDNVSEGEGYKAVVLNLFGWWAEWAIPSPSAGQFWPEVLIWHLKQAQQGLAVSAKQGRQPGSNLAPCREREA